MRWHGLRRRTAWGSGPGSVVTNRAAMGRIHLLALASDHLPVVCAHLHGPGPVLDSKAKTAQVTSAAWGGWYASTQQEPCVGQGLGGLCHL